MALVSLAVFSKENELAYAKDFQEYQRLDPLDDPFGLLGQSNQKDGANNSCSVRHEFIYYSAIDRLNDIFHKKRSTNDNSMWLGLMLPVDELRVYGYVTNSQVKFMAIIADTYSFSMNQQQRETELKSFFASLHTLYVDYTLNPFQESETIISMSCIKSNRFNDGVNRLAQDLNQQSSGTTF